MMAYFRARVQGSTRTTRPSARSCACVHSCFTSNTFRDASEQQALGDWSRVVFTVSRRCCLRLLSFLEAVSSDYAYKIVLWVPPPVLLWKKIHLCIRLVHARYIWKKLVDKGLQTWIHGGSLGILWRAPAAPTGLLSVTLAVSVNTNRYVTTRSKAKNEPLLQEYLGRNCPHRCETIKNHDRFCTRRG